MSVHEPLPPGCEPACPGCRHRLLTGDESVSQKARYLQRVLAPWARLIEPVATEPAARFGYRDRVTLNARWSPGQGWRFGLMRRDELIAIHECPVHTPRVNGLVAALRATLPPADRLALAYVHVAGAQVTLIVKSHVVADDALDALKPLLAEVGVEGLWVHTHPSAGRRLFARSGWRLAWGRAESFDCDGFVHGPTAFRQLLPSLHRASIERAADHLQPGPDVAVLDLYCGLGATLARWTTAGATALGVELAGGAVEAAARNAPAAQVLRGTCVQRLPQAMHWWNAQESRRVLYVNPPRTGLDPGVTQAIVDTLRPDRIAYLSCSAGTLARDLSALEQHGYSIDAIAPYDFFPGTQHVECLALALRSDD